MYYTGFSCSLDIQLNEKLWINSDQFLRHPVLLASLGPETKSEQEMIYSLYRSEVEYLNRLRKLHTNILLTLKSIPSFPDFANGKFSITLTIFQLEAQIDRLVKCGSVFIEKLSHTYDTIAVVQSFWKIYLSYVTSIQYTLAEYISNNTIFTETFSILRRNYPDFQSHIRQFEVEMDSLPIYDVVALPCKRSRLYAGFLLRLKDYAIGADAATALQSAHNVYSWIMRATPKLKNDSIALLEGMDALKTDKLDLEEKLSDICIKMNCFDIESILKSKLAAIKKNESEPVLDLCKTFSFLSIDYAKTVTAKSKVTRLDFTLLQKVLLITKVKPKSLLSRKLAIKLFCPPIPLSGLEIIRLPNYATCKRPAPATKSFHHPHPSRLVQHVFQLKVPKQGCILLLCAESADLLADWIAHVERRNHVAETGKATPGRCHGATSLKLLLEVEWQALSPRVPDNKPLDQLASEINCIVKAQIDPVTYAALAFRKPLASEHRPFLLKYAFGPVTAKVYSSTKENAAWHPMGSCSIHLIPGELEGAESTATKTALFDDHIENLIDAYTAETKTASDDIPVYHQMIIRLEESGRIVFNGRLDFNVLSNFADHNDVTLFFQTLSDDPLHGQILAKRPTDKRLRIRFPARKPNAILADPQSSVFFEYITHLTCVLKTAESERFISTQQEGRAKEGKRFFSLFDEDNLMPLSERGKDAQIYSLPEHQRFRAQGRVPPWMPEEALKATKESKDLKKILIFAATRVAMHFRSNGYYKSNLELDLHIYRADPKEHADVALQLTFFKSTALPLFSGGILDYRSFAVSENLALMAFRLQTGSNASAAIVFVHLAKPAFSSLLVEALDTCADNRSFVPLITAPPQEPALDAADSSLSLPFSSSRDVLFRVRSMFDLRKNPHALSAEEHSCNAGKQRLSHSESINSLQSLPLHVPSMPKPCSTEPLSTTRALAHSIDLVDQFHILKKLTPFSSHMMAQEI